MTSPTFWQTLKGRIVGLGKRPLLPHQVLRKGLTMAAPIRIPAWLASRFRRPTAPAEKLENTPSTLDYRSELFQRTVKDFRDREVFRDPSFNRLAYAEEIGVPPRTLSEAIRTHAQCSFPTFVNRFRISHAIVLMRTIHHGHPMEEVAAHSGFASRRTFYRAIKLIYGATPLDLLRDGWALDPLYEQLPVEPPATDVQRGEE